MRSHRIKATSLPTLDVRLIYNAIRSLGYERQDRRTALFLSQLELSGASYQFVSNERGFDRLRILCPSCKRKFIKLVMLEGDFRCRGCHKLRDPLRCQPRAVLAARYFRPWMLLWVLETKLSNCVSERQKAILRNKVRKLRAAMPEYIVDLSDEGVAPLTFILPRYFTELARAL